MSFNCGIIGLPNVGKSTIFNALSGAGAQIANYPFCTIDPNKGIVPVPDERLEKIAHMLKKSDPIHAKIEFIDVAGLVSGASKGEGLGNRFLGHIRNVDAVVHVVRCFAEPDVVHVTGGVDPVRDAGIINTELMLADLELLTRAGDKVKKLAQSGDKDAKARLAVIERACAHLDGGRLLAGMGLDEDDLAALGEYGLITLKPVLYLANIDEGGADSPAVAGLRAYAGENGAEFLYLIGKIEEEISHLPAGEKQEFLDAMGLAESGLARLIRAAVKLLGMVTFYTAATELQAWMIPDGTTMQKAAGKIHKDMERGFIRAEVFSFEDLERAGDDHKLRELGLMRAEGRDHPVRDGDIVKFLFNV
ncbi:MAG: redox-regulated ATPase YchF [Spirochaetes bacterium]|nr:MAG: redox-regulated ATPase YchF [Spirochaetota bacterium]